MNRNRFLIVIFSLISFSAGAQYADFKLQNYHPASPTAFNFLKYTEMPVSEYTGVPNISVPIFTFDEDGTTVPIKLTYHAGGFRVNQEASWVGLGWDLQFGSIVQEINDVDDYYVTDDGYLGYARVPLMPDFNNSPIPSLYPTYYIYGCPIQTNVSYTNPVPVLPPQKYYSYNIYTAYYIPINGNRTNQSLGQQLINDPHYDSEPDIFSANFLGHSIKFLKDFQTNQIIVLNKKGYTVTRTGNTYKIVVPSGEEFWFETQTFIESYSESVGGIGNVGTSSSNLMPSSRIWMLTKIVTKNKQEIVFNYTLSSEKFDNFPAYSEKWSSSIASVVTSLGEGSPTFQAYSNSNINSLGKTYSYSKEKRFQLNNITFNNGLITFYTSSRNDLLGGNKLDSIKVESTTKVINTFKFNYSYFDASSVGGNVFSTSNISLFSTAKNLRLKLLSLSDNSGAVHSFSYNSTSLPPKNSLAQDFWGFYNGQLSNTSLIPNPARLNNTQLSGVTGLADNGNNNSSNLIYTQAGILKEVHYPTGGKTVLEYELNQFDNYLVPDFSTTTNTISSGNGLRVSTVKFSDLSGVSTDAKKTIYSYGTGKALLPLQISRKYTMNTVWLSTTTPLGAVTNDEVIEINAKGFFSTNALGSANSVGYDEVTKRDVDGNGVSIGKTVSTFNNTPDNISSTANASSQLNASLPALKQLSSISGSLSDFPENGTVKEVFVYNANDVLVKKDENTYVTQVSNTYYGARVFGYSSLYYRENCNSGGLPQYWTNVPLTLIGYYTLYDIESLLTKTETTVYDENNISMLNTISYSYDGYNQLSFKQSRGSNGEYLEEYFDHAYDYFQQTGNDLLWTNNRLTEVTGFKTQKRKSNYSQILASTESKKNYGVSNSNIVVNSVTVTDRLIPSSQPKITTIDQYDLNANPLQVTTHDGMKNCLIWDYSNKYVVAEIKNAPLHAVAATSFEADGKGRFNYTGVPIADINAPTGKKVYPLINNITASLNDPTKTYIVSLWASQLSLSINSSTTPIRTGTTINGYTYYEWEVTGTNSITIAGAGSVNIDELRVYPKDAQIQTYTYEPLVGITTTCDVNNIITYYEYDNTGRLKLIRDQNRKIIKTYDYKFQTTPAL